MADTTQDAIRNPETRRERSDVTLRVIGLLVGIIAGSVALVIVLLLVIFPSAVSDHPKGLATPMPAPRLQPDAAADMRAYRNAAQQQLNSYGWVDKEKGIVHIPISEAMRRIAERGIADWPKTTP
jgi:hypothetical protein